MSSMVQFWTGEKIMNDKLVLVDHPMEVWVHYSYDVKVHAITICLLL